MRATIIWFTLFCFVTTQSSALAAGAHDEGVAAGRAANPVSRGQVTAPSARSVVPAYSASPAETRYYGQPNLATQGSAQLAACVSRPNDPVCQALRGATASANTPRPMVSASDPAVAAARDITRSPSATLENLASYYSGCSTTTTEVQATTQPRSCLRTDGAGLLGCTRTLGVGIERSTNCTPGDWFAHAAQGNAGLDAQCLPDRPDTAQRLRVTRDGTPLAFFTVDMTLPTPMPRSVAVLDTTYSWMSGRPLRTMVWVADPACTADECALTGLIAPEFQETCTYLGEGAYDCKSTDTFLKRYGACSPGTQGGELIQSTVCTTEGVCSTTALDGARCYAPSSSPTPLNGIDVTGTLAGDQWIEMAQREVIGWTPNPAAGPIPTLQLRYTKARTRITETDRWDDRCPAIADLTGGGRCQTVTEPVCTDGPDTKWIDGAAVTRDCWQTTRTLSCAGATGSDGCAPLVAAGCTPSTSTCRRSDPATGRCLVTEEGYLCPVPAQTRTSTSSCPSDVFCVQGSCFDIRQTQDGDFARSMSMLEAGREAGVYLDTDRMQVFRGEENRCRNRLLKNCCYTDNAGAGMTNQSMFGTGSSLVYDVLMNSENREFIYQGMSALLLGEGFSGSFTTYGVTVAVNGAAVPAGSVAIYSSESLVIAFDPWTLVIAVVIYIILSMMSCNEGEGRLAMKEGARLCHTVGTWCSTCLTLLGSCTSCTEQTTSKCCFNSMLARIINEQGRQQIGKGWGNEQSPDCSGFTVAELQSLNFSAMDLTEFYASLIPTLPDLTAIQDRGSSRVPNCYYGQGRCQ